MNPASTRIGIGGLVHLAVNACGHLVQPGPGGEIGEEFSRFEIATSFNICVIKFEL